MSDETPIPVQKTVWYKNAALLTNVVTVGVLILTNYCGVQIPAELQTGIIAIINLGLQVPTMATTSAKALDHNRAIRSQMVK